MISLVDLVPCIASSVPQAQKVVSGQGMWCLRVKALY